MTYYIALLILLLNLQIFSQTTYYIDPVSGDDANSGETTNAAWKTLKNVNRNTFNNGDKIAFKSSNTFTGSTINCQNGVTYTSYGNGSKPKLKFNERVFNVKKVNNVSIINLEVESNSWVYAERSNNLSIENCYFHHYVKPGHKEATPENASNIPIFINNSDYFKISNSRFEGVFTSIYQDMMAIQGQSQFGIIENNYIKGGSHNSMQIYGYFENYNDKSYNNDSPNHIIVRQNHFYNLAHHCLSTNVGTWMTLIEGNYFERAGTGIDSSSKYNKYDGTSTIGSAIYYYGSGILRNNIVQFSGSNADNRAIDGLVRYATDGRRSEAFDQAIYNNIFWNNHSEGYKTGVYFHVDFGWPDNLRYENISFVNNAFGGNKNPTKEDLFIFRANTKQEFKGDYRNNSFEKPMIRYGTGGYTAFTVNEFNNNSTLGTLRASGNLHTAPQFISPNLIPNSGDVETAFSYFHLKNSSKLIDSGDFLTYTNSAGNNSNRIKVRDAKFFMDGWGISDGDLIQIGNDILKIIKVEYDTNTLVVDRNITWTNNMGVSFPYQGSKPDIGISENYQSDNNVELGQTITPIISNQPKSGNANVGGEITFSIVVSGDFDIGYQWWKFPYVSESESKIINNQKYSGATSNSLTIKNVTAEDANIQYICEVYNINDHSNSWTNSEPVSIILAQSQDPTNITSLKVFLESPYAENGMVTNINSENYLPKKHPYRDLPWDLQSDAEIDEIKPDYIDWLIIELRAEVNKISFRKPAILTDDGVVLNVDRTKLSFNNITPDKYYITIIHRNHLAIMSSIKVDVKNNAPIHFDFTNSLYAAYGNDALKELGDGRFGMFAGDADANGVINNLDFGQVANSIPFKGYSKADLDMNVNVNVLDYEVINQNILKNTQVPK